MRKTCPNGGTPSSALGASPSRAAADEPQARHTASATIPMSSRRRIVRRLSRVASATATRLAAPRLESPLHLPLRVAVGDVPALVALLLAAGECDLDLHLAVLEVDPCRHEGQTALARLPEQRDDLAAVEQELAVAVGLVIRDVPLRVLVDVSSDEPDLALAHVRERPRKVGAAGAQRLHLRARERDARLVALEQVVVVPRSPVLCDQFGPAGHSLALDQKFAEPGVAFVHHSG